MSEDKFLEFTRESWFSRIGGAIKGVVVGLVLFAAAFPLLWSNEGRAVRTYKTLQEGSGAVVSVSAQRVDPQNSGKLVHVTGRADTEAVLKDPVFGVSTTALKLRRVAEMYQWKQTSQSETSKKVGGGTETATTYKYSKIWSEELIDSSEFKQPAGHQNPAALLCESTEWIAEPVQVGAFRLPPSLVQKIYNYAPFVPEANTPVAEELRDKAKPQPGGFYLGSNPAVPQVGDVRVSFQVTKPTEVSIIARQAQNTFEPYVAKAGGTINLLQVGTLSPEAMISHAQASNTLLTWIFRAIGFILMLVGLNMVFRPLGVIADVLPILGSITRAGTGAIAFLLAAVLSAVTIAVAWVVYRPLLGGILLAVAVGSAVALAGMLKKAKAKANPRVPAPGSTGRTGSAAAVPDDSQQLVGASRN